MKPNGLVIPSEEKEYRRKKDFFTLEVGLIANIVLAGVKTSIGVLAHSPALLADGINSTSDVAYYVVVAFFMRVAGKPPDDEHPYGHSQLESIGALVVGAFVVSTAIAIFWNSIGILFDLLSGVVEVRHAAPIALWVALITIGLKIGLTFYTMRVGRQTNNPAVLALACDHRNDIYSAAAAAVGISLGLLGYRWVDPLAGALVSFIILHTGVTILRESTADLMDTVPGRVLNKQVQGLLKDIPEVKQIDEINAHRFGPYLVINITVCVDGDLTVGEGDRIATQVERLLEENIELVRRVHVHYHPLISIEKTPLPSPGKWRGGFLEK